MSYPVLIKFFTLFRNRLDVHKCEVMVIRVNSKICLVFFIYLTCMVLLWRAEFSTNFSSENVNENHAQMRVLVHDVHFNGPNTSTSVKRTEDEAYTEYSKQIKYRWKRVSKKSDNKPTYYYSAFQDQSKSIRLVGATFRNKEENKECCFYEFLNGTVITIDNLHTVPQCTIMPESKGLRYVSLK